MSISQEQAAAREAARTKTGEFGFQQHTESAVRLSTDRPEIERREFSFRTDAYDAVQDMLQRGGHDPSHYDIDGILEHGFTVDGNLHRPHNHDALWAVVGANRYVDVEPGDSHDFGYQDDPRVAHYSITTDDETGEKTASLVIEHDFSDCLPDEVQENLDEEQRQDYLDDRWLVVENVLQQRYAGDESSGVQIDASAEVPRLEFYRQMGTDKVSEFAAADAAWNRTDGVRFLNESDDGTFGSERLSRVIADRLQDYDDAVENGVPERLAAEGFECVLPEGGDAWIQPRQEHATGVVDRLGISGVSRMDPTKTGFETDGHLGDVHAVRLSRVADGKMLSYDSAMLTGRGYHGEPPTAAAVIEADIENVARFKFDSVEEITQDERKVLGPGGIRERLIAFLGDEEYAKAGGV